MPRSEKTPPKLSDSQLVVLTTACQRPDGGIFPVTLKLKGNAIGNVLKSLLNKGLLEEIPGRADDTIWRYADGAPLTLRATRAAYDTLDIEPTTDPATEGRLAAAADDGGPVGGTPADQGIAAAKPEARARKAKDKSGSKKKRTDDEAKEPRKGTKLAQVIAMLRRSGGATLQQIVDATDWQPHTVRAVLSHAIAKKLGLPVTSEKTDARGRVYRLGA